MRDNAKAYAEVFAQEGGLEHSPVEDRKRQGENLYIGYAVNEAPTAEVAVTDW